MSRGADDCGWRVYPPRLPLVLVVGCTDPDWYEDADIWEAVNAAEQDRINREMLAIFTGPRGLGRKILG